MAKHVRENGSKQFSAENSWPINAIPEVLGNEKQGSSNIWSRTCAETEVMNLDKG